jgi:SOS-response transcriptional repressor LexA
MYDYIKQIKGYTDNEIYLTIKKLIIRQDLGYYINYNKLEALEKEAQSRNKSIYDFALKDGLFISNQLREEMGNTKVINIKRIDFLSEEELKILLFSIGAAKNHPLVSDSDSKKVSFVSYLGIEPENILICQVSGDSMINANIFEGDSLILDTKSTPRNNDIVVVTLNNETLVKRISINNGQISLISENDNYPTYILNNEDEFNILGKVKYIIHSA